MQRELIEIDNISTHLYCVICEEVFLDPRRLGCGYILLLFIILVIHFVMTALNCGKINNRHAQFVEKNSAKRGFQRI